MKDIRYTLTVFTPTYNRANLLERSYKALLRQTSHDFCWLIIDDGSKDDTRDKVCSWMNPSTMIVKGEHIIGESKDAPWFHIHYCYKENGGLHTGYNKAIELMSTEICVCVDSDDYMPDNAVEIIVNFWIENRRDDIGGFIGLDYYEGTNEPVGGYFSETSEPVHLVELGAKLNHHGDTKMVIRVDLFKNVAPQPTFPGEKNFNPIYMIKLIDQKYSFMTINRNLCFVDYQTNGMTANIFKQYANSPRSFAALRIVSMKQPYITYRRYVIEHLHYVAEKFLAKSLSSMWNEGASKFLVTLLIVPGYFFSKYIIYKAKK